MKKPIATPDLIKAYAETKSLKRVGAMFGVQPQLVHYRLKQAGVDTSQAGLWTEEQKQLVRNHYENTQFKNRLKLDEFAASLGKQKSQVSLLARKMGLSDIKRTFDQRRRRRKFQSEEELRAHISVTRKRWIAENGHPRGSLGMRHSEQTKTLISKHSKERWNTMTKKQREEYTTKIAKARSLKPARFRTETTWKAGWRDIGSKRIYVRSRWEANMARLLEFRRANGDILDWEYEPITFWFEKIKRGVRSYKPDFRVTENDMSQHYVEVKGWMCARSKTTLKRMKKYHPDVKIDLVDGKRFRVIHNQMKHVIKDWEDCKF